MNSLVVSLLAACFASGANLFFRKSSEHSSGKNSYNYYLLFFYLCSFVVSFFLVPFKSLEQFNPVMFGVGCLVGTLSMSMMWLTSRALLNGPAGLTFAFQNASGIFPGILLFTIFGPLFGFQITLFQILGMGLVMWGLFLGSTNKQDQAVSMRWLFYAIGCCIVQIFALSLIHWRCLLFTNNLPSHFLIPWNLSECADAWFLPGQFGTALLLQIGITIIYEKRLCTRREAAYGFLGGFSNIISSFLLLISTKIAFPVEKGLIFPCFAAATMIICNLWANRLYKEKFNIKANSCAAVGIIISSF